MSTNELLDTLYESTKVGKLEWVSGITSDMFYLNFDNKTSLVIQKELNISQMGWDIVIYIYSPSKELIKSFRINDAPNHLTPVSEEFLKGAELMGMINGYINKKDSAILNDIVNQIRNKIAI